MTVRRKTTDAEAAASARAGGAAAEPDAPVDTLIEDYWLGLAKHSSRRARERGERQ